MKKSGVYSLYAVFALIAVIVAVLTAVNKELRDIMFLGRSFYLIAALVACWLFHVFLYFKNSFSEVRGFIAEHRWGILAAALMTIIVFMSVPPYLRVLQDETNLLSVSRSMLNDRSVDNPAQAQYENFKLTDERYSFPKRPFLFSFSTYLVHLLTGYRTTNPFVVNGLALWAILLLVYVFARRWGAPIIAMGVMLLAVSQPIVIQTATSGGMETLFTLGSLVCLFSLWIFIREPNSLRFKFLFLYLMLFAHIRYEAPVYVALIGLALLLCGKVKKEYFENTPSLSLTPLFLLPTFWQRFFVDSDLQVPAGEKAFALSHLWNHTVGFFESMFKFDYFLPYSPLVNLLGVVGALWFLWLFFRKKIITDKNARLFCWLVSGWMAVHWIILTAHFGSFLTEPVGARLWMFMMLIMAVSAGWLLSNIFVKWKMPGGFLIAACFFFLVYHPLSIRNYFSNGVVSAREFRLVLNELKKFSKRDVLVIAEPSAQYVSHEYASLKFERVNQDPGLIFEGLIQKRFQDAVVVQQWDLGTDQATPETALLPVFKTEPFFELKITRNRTLRLSRIVL